MSSPAPWDDAKAHLLAADLGVPIAWPNEQFDKPEPPSIWVAVEMTGNVLRPIELGRNGVWQEDGTLYAHVMAPAGIGTESSRLLGKTIASVFRNVPPGPISYLGASIGDGAAEDEDGAWWRLTVSIDWQYQDIDVST